MWLNSSGAVFIYHRSSLLQIHSMMKLLKLFIVCGWWIWLVHQYETPRVGVLLNSHFKFVVSYEQFEISTSISTWNVLSSAHTLLIKANKKVYLDQRTEFCSSHVKGLMASLPWHTVWCDFYMCYPVEDIIWEEWKKIWSVWYFHLKFKFDQVLHQVKPRD